MAEFKERNQSSPKNVEVTYNKLVAETDKAMLLDIGGKEMWMPKSHCEIDEDSKTAYMTDWIAEQKGITI